LLRYGFVGFWIEQHMITQNVPDLALRLHIPLTSAGHARSSLLYQVWLHDFILHSLQLPKPDRQLCCTCTS
jgi:hypothetical protein